METINAVAPSQRRQIERMLDDIDELRRNRREMERVAPPPG